MPLLDIAIAHSSFQNHLGYTRVQLFINGSVPNYALLQDEERWPLFRKSHQIKGNVNLTLGFSKKSLPKFLVKAVATLEPKCTDQNSDEKKESNALSSVAKSVSEMAQTDSSIEDTEEVNERERLRRLRISKANKGNTPWNKGRKHSPETLRRIRERTRLAMQSPKVKMKLVNIGHAQSSETREKIAVGVRMGWQKRRKKLLLQETCLFDWQNLIAEAARKGIHDEEELQWDSYEILNEQLQQEWLDSIELRRTTPRPKSSKRAPKSLEQRKKIAEAIAAKWADPDYRSRVRTGLLKYHGIPEGAERKTRRKPSGETRLTSTSTKKLSDLERAAANESKSRTQGAKLKKRNTPKYKDPLAKSKLEMLKSIRAQRVASEPKKNEALERAKVLVAEAQKAAKALEAAAMRNPVARASLIEAQKLIAEATQSIELVENGEFNSEDNVAAFNQNIAEQGGESLEENAGQGYLGEYGIVETLTRDPGQSYRKRVNGSGQSLTEDADQMYLKGANGIRSLQPSEGQNRDANLHKPKKLDRLDAKYQLPMSLGEYELTKLNLESLVENSGVKKCNDQQHSETNGCVRLNGISSPNGVKLQCHEEHSSPVAKSATKKWVRGRLVEVAEGDNA